VPAVQADQALDVAVSLRVAVAEVVRLVDEQHVGVAIRPGVELLAPHLLLRQDRHGNVRLAKLVPPHLAQARRADHQRLLPQVVGEVLQQLLADPRLAQANGVGDHHAIVAREDLPRLLDGILLKLRKLHSRAGRRGCRLGSEVVTEILVEGLHVDLPRRVLLAAELRCIEQVDQVILEVTGILPLPLVPLLKIDHRPRPHLALHKLPCL